MNRKSASAGSVLDRIVSDTLADVERRMREATLDQLHERALNRNKRNDFVGALRQPGVGLMAEIKRGSPSKGCFAPDLVPAELARTYLQIGAVAVSVLTSPAFFATDDDLLEASAALDGSGLPILRKEFHLHPYQVVETAALGADAFLLIAKTLDAPALKELAGLGLELEMTAFIEVTDESETEMAINAGATAIGINNRNLHTFTEDLGTTERLRGLIPSDIAVVAASGVRTRADMQRMEACGVDAVLIGEALASADDPRAKAKALLGR